MAGTIQELGFHETVHVIEDSKFVKALKDFVAGSVGGFVCKTVEYPLDTVKVILQTQKGSGLGVFSCFRDVVRTNGIGGLYKGLASPLIGSMAENATIFSCFGLTKSAIVSAVPSASERLWTTMLSGAISGVAVTAILTPVELIKCRMQVQSRPGEVQQYRSTWNCVVQTVMNEGVKNGLYRGALATLLREIPGNAAWFGVYETACTMMTPVNGTKDDLKVHQLMLAGGLSGMAYWTAFFPADTVKSCMQTDPAAAAAGFRATFLRLYREVGLRALYRGWGLTVSRAMPSNALLFLAFETVERFLRRV